MRPCPFRSSSGRGHLIRWPAARAVARSQGATHPDGETFAALPKACSPYAHSQGLLRCSERDRPDRPAGGAGAQLPTLRAEEAACLPLLGTLNRDEPESEVGTLAFESCRASVYPLLPRLDALGQGHREIQRVGLGRQPHADERGAADDDALVDRGRTFNSVTPPHVADHVPPGPELSPYRTAS
jgi:hypothetical protein